MKLSRFISGMAYLTQGTAYRQMHVVVKPFYGLKPIFEGTVQKLVEAYAHNKHDFGSAGADSWMVVNFRDYFYQHSNEPQVAKHILIEVV